MKTFDETTECLAQEEVCPASDKDRAWFIEGRNSARESLAIACRALERIERRCKQHKAKHAAAEMDFIEMDAREALAAIKARGDWVGE